MVPSGFVNIAHQGASAYAPEKTFSAFDKALSLGVDQVELDVHFSKDAHVVVIHDDNLERTTNGPNMSATALMTSKRFITRPDWPGGLSQANRKYILGSGVIRQPGNSLLTSLAT